MPASNLDKRSNNTSVHTNVKGPAVAGAVFVGQIPIPTYAGKTDQQIDDWQFSVSTTSARGMYCVLEIPSSVSIQTKDNPKGVNLWDCFCTPLVPLYTPDQQAYKVCQDLIQNDSIYRTGLIEISLEINGNSMPCIAAIDRLCYVPMNLLEEIWSVTGLGRLSESDVRKLQQYRQAFQIIRETMA